MNRSIKLVTSFLAFVLFVSAVSASCDSEYECTSFSAYILGPSPPPASIINISVPDSVFLGNVSKGSFVRTSSDDKIRVTNSGNVDVTVTPLLNGGSDEIFNNLYFGIYASDTPKRIGEFSFDINASGTKKYAEFYAYLNLTDYTGDLSVGSVTYKYTDVKYRIVSK